MITTQLTTSSNQEDWRQCANWLNRCRIISNDHQALLKSGNVLQLVKTLMDGVVLCHLLNTLSNGEVDLRKMKDFSLRPQQSQFLCLQNIRLFLNLCEKEFNIDQKYLFEPNDLYQAKNFGKVIEFLAELSTSTRALKSGIEGFPLANTCLQKPHEYYNDLEDINDMLAADDPNYADIEEETNEMIYDTIVHGGSKLSQPTTDNEPTTARSCCLKEIISTEKNYVDLLKMLIDKYMHPLSKILSNQELEEIFKFIDKLHTIHRELLANLIIAVNSNLKFSVGEVFVKVRDRLLIYGEYCGHVLKAQGLVLEILKNDVEKRTKIEACQTQSDNYSKFQLPELLTVPMQRVLKYHLLLEQLCKLTDDDHAEKTELLRALADMRELAQTINEVKRDLDTISAIDQIQASLLEISLPLDKKLSSYGRLHIDGELRVFSHHDSKSKTRYVFLFDKVTLLCKSKGDSFTFMAAYHITKGCPQAVKLPTKKSGKFSYEFNLPLAGEREDVSLIFFAKTEEIRTSWITAANVALSNLFPIGAKDNGYLFDMHCFKTTTYCCVCAKLLQGVFYQGYRCRDTGLAAHKICLQKVSQVLPPRTYSSSQSRVSSGLRNWQNSQSGLSNGNNCGSVISRIASSISYDGGNKEPSHSHSVSAGSSSFSASDSFDTEVFISPNKLDRENQGTQAMHRHSIIHTNSAGPTLYTMPHRRPYNSNSSTNAHKAPNFVTAIKDYFGDPHPPSGLDTKTSNPLRFHIGNRILLTQPFQSSSWLHGYLNDQDGWFPSDCVEAPIFNEPSTPISRRQSCISGRSTQSGVDDNLFFHTTSRLSDVQTNQSNDSPTLLMRTSSARSYFSLGSNDKHTFSYRNESLAVQIWYCGEMDRQEATRVLSGCPDGTFLVRVSKNLQRMGEYSLSVVYKYPRHIKIQRINFPDSPTTYCLSKPHKFQSIPALIEYYSHVSLNECFDEVSTCLDQPYQRCPTDSVLFTARALYDYSNDSHPRMLRLLKGDIVTVISNKGADQGWWKGWINGKTGFFPLAFVRREPVPNQYQST